MSMIIHKINIQKLFLENRNWKLIFTASLLRTRANFKNDIIYWMINIIQKLIKLRQSIYLAEIMPLRTLNKSNAYFKIRSGRSLTCLNLDRTVVNLILIGSLSSEHSNTSFEHDSFPQLIGSSMASAVLEIRTEREKKIYNFDYSAHPSLTFSCLLGHEYWSHIFLSYIFLDEMNLCAPKQSNTEAFSQ